MVEWYNNYINEIIDSQPDKAYIQIERASYIADAD